MKSFLLEVFSEEIPARMQADAIIQLSGAFANELKKSGFEQLTPKMFVTPRRLAILVDNIPDTQPDITLERKGPKTSAPQPAIDGFLRTTGLKLEQLTVKDDVYFAIIEQKGQPTANLLKEIIEKILADFAWAKSMRWGNKPTRWVRPIHSILCLFGNDIIPVEFAGLNASNTTSGHRFLTPAEITINEPSEYESKLRAAKVILNREERLKFIAEKANELAKANNLELKQDVGLLNEVVGLVEYPNLLLGTIDEKYMDLPAEVLVSEMRNHQKYFALLQDGKLANKFVITANISTEDNGKAIIAGNERVLRARLADGRFFYDQDRKKPLSDWAKDLEKVTFHAKIGTIAEKVNRIEQLAEKISEFTKADKKLVFRAAQLSKADLVTGMVGEFPELQGIMGRYYAIAQGENQQIADAIRDHYLPLGADSPTPTEPVSICVALADKFDTLVQMFAVGEKPTGSKDPFALRRAALGIIRIILENNLRISLKSIINQELINFFYDRLKVMLKEKGIRHDIIDAVVDNNDDDLVRIVSLAKALQEFLATYDGDNLLAGYKRAVNILNIEEKKDNKKYQPDFAGKSTTEHEEALMVAYSKIIPTINTSLMAEHFSEAMEQAAKLRKPVDDFLDNVFINDENQEVREYRLGILAALRDNLNVIANFALIS